MLGVLREPVPMPALPASTPRWALCGVWFWAERLRLLRLASHSLLRAARRAQAGAGDTGEPGNGAGGRGRGARGEHRGGSRADSCGGGGGAAALLGACLRGAAVDADSRLFPHTHTHPQLGAAGAEAVGRVGGAAGGVAAATLCCADLSLCAAMGGTGDGPGGEGTREQWGHGCGHRW
ncbi:hypothetical protein B484DRAFT_453527 [Ochromonadaceae sp. CCMP2298]|nr:hypothetical protein B484DRAFT_453527 [Ochromonadaceae sp. CCMP2298]